MSNEDKELIAIFDGWVKMGYHRPVYCFDVDGNNKQLVGHKFVKLEGYNSGEELTPLYKKEKVFGTYWLDKMPYNSDWNWIMGVCKKIQKVRFKGFPLLTNLGSSGVVIMINESNVAGEKYEGERVIADTLNINYFTNVPEEEVSLEESIGIAIIRFVKWYNLNKDLCVN